MPLCSSSTYSLSSRFVFTQQHVQDGRKESLDGYVKTFSKRLPPDGNGGVFALDCEMVSVTRVSRNVTTLEKHSTGLGPKLLSQITVGLFLLFLDHGHTFESAGEFQFREVVSLLTSTFVFCCVAQVHRLRLCLLVWNKKQRRWCRVLE